MTPSSSSSENATAFVLFEYNILYIILTYIIYIRTYSVPLYTLERVLLFCVTVHVRNKICIFDMYKLYSCIIVLEINNCMKLLICNLKCMHLLLVYLVKLSSLQSARLKLNTTAGYNVI